jgi:tripartite-type tricarboxylate transporter receptor subunit TctC
LLLVAVGASAAQAQDKYPSKPIKIVLPYGAGSATDIITRIMCEQLRQSLGQSCVVENKPGAFGIIAIEEMARARPDGYTLQVGNVSTNAITPVIVPEKMKINYERDVVPVTNLIDVPAFLVVTTTNFSVKDVKELVDYAKKNPGKLRYGTVGVGSYPHYDFAYFAKRAGDLDAIAIHNKAGASGVINDMVTGDTQAAFLNVASTAAMVRAGKIKPLAIVNHKRLPTSRRADHAGTRLPGRRHHRLERDVRARRHAAPGARNLAQGRRRRAGRASRQGGADQAALQHRPLEIGGRGQDLADG